MTPEVTAVVVNHRSAAECAACAVSLRAAFAEGGVSGEIVVVDCASGDAEVAALAGLAVETFVPLPENRGYSGGINAGLARARGRKFLLCNADVEFLPGSVAPLLAALDDPRVGAAAPRSQWDADGRMFLPPGDPPGFWSELLRLSAGHFAALDAGRFAAFAREALRLWQNGGRARHLVGAVLAVRRDVLDRVGRFDERFPFEHEETEWEDRVRRAGYELRYVPDARIRHRWAVSASRNPDSARLREISRRRYRERAYGPLGRRILDWAGRSKRANGWGPVLPSPALASRPGAWLAFSPNPTGYPFAGSALSEDFRLPADIERALAAGRYRLSVFSESDGRPLESYVWEKPA